MEMITLQCLVQLKITFGSCTTTIPLIQCVCYTLLVWWSLRVEGPEAQPSAGSSLWLGHISLIVAQASPCCPCQCWILPEGSRRHWTQITLPLSTVALYTSLNYQCYLSADCFLNLHLSTYLLLPSISTMLSLSTTWNSKWYHFWILGFLDIFQLAPVCVCSNTENIFTLLTLTFHYIVYMFLFLYFRLALNFVAPWFSLPPLPTDLWNVDATRKFQAYFKTTDWLLIDQNTHLTRGPGSVWWLL